MGISKLTVSAITDTAAEVKWETDMDASTELRLGKKQADGSYSMTDMPATGSSCTVHTYALSGLDASSGYRAEAKSLDDASGNYMICDDGSSPVDFTTAARAAAGAVAAAITLSGRRAVYIGTTATVSASAKDSSGAAAASAVVAFSTTAGSVSPSSVSTDSCGCATTVFTGTSRATVEVTASSGSVTAVKKIWVCKTWIDLLMAAFGIPLA